ncbi:hypothetical protein [Bacillus sp. MRMR6]|uniref:hypothetical protein n=1 Tax=Bacillus sp. MRMR6 TaxID=1928617 RepID=UPI00158C69F8|nr:hypothetical protein [Bacillus sp. MRMR6]
MVSLQSKLEAIIEDVNQENGMILSLFERITDSLFFLIKWAGIPMVIYLLIAASFWQ